MNANDGTFDLPNQDYLNQNQQNGAGTVIAPKFENTVISELSKLSKNKGVLLFEIIKKAKSFLKKEVLQELRSGTFTWLGDALRQVQVNAMMDNDQIVGLLLAMTALGGVFAESMTTFVSDLDNERRSLIQGLYEA